MIEFLKIRNVKDPIWDFNENAGIDVFIPEKDSFTDDELKTFGTNVEFNDNQIIIKAHGDVLIPSGIKSKFPNNVALIAMNKSGIATKKKLDVGASVIDTSYQGEWHFHMVNWSDEDQVIEFGQKIVQFVPYLLYTNGCMIHTNTDEKDFFTNETSRGTGGFGSTGV